MGKKTHILPDESSLLRHVPKNRLRRDGETGQIVGFLPAAFELRNGELYLSNVWVEYFGKSEPANLYQSIVHMRTKRTIKTKDAYARGTVGLIKQICKSHNCKVRILHEPTIGDSAYAALRQLVCELGLLEELALKAWGAPILEELVP